MSVPVQHPMYIDGQFVTWRGDAWIDVVNPATEAVISRIPDGQAEDARKAIDAAERAQPEWEALPAIERASWLRKISAGIDLYILRQLYPPFQWRQKQTLRPESTPAQAANRGGRSRHYR